MIPRPTSTGAVTARAAWFRTPFGLLYLALIATAAILGAGIGARPALAVLLVMLAVFVPYKISRNAAIGARELARTQATLAAADEAAARERAVASAELERALSDWARLRAEDRDGLRSSLERLEAALTDLDGRGASQAGDVRAAIQGLAERLDDRLATLATDQQRLNESVQNALKVAERFEALSVRMTDHSQFS